MIALQATDPMNFPLDLLNEDDTALVLFAAGFMGVQDAYWIKEAGMKATCIDSDPDKLAEMSMLYPDSWEFVIADAYSFALNETQNPRFDIVTLDPWTQDFDKCASWIAEWCRLARKAVVIGTGITTFVESPPGWKITDKRKRSDYDGGVYWTVLEPA